MTNPTALVTGGSGGVGGAVATLLADLGREVWVASRDREACERVASAARRAGGAARALPLDVTDGRSVAEVAERLAAADGRLELVQCAGSVMVHDLLEDQVHGQDAYRRMLAEHLDGPRRLVAALMPAMRRRGASVVNVASAAGLRAFPRTAAYVVAKHAMVGWTRAAAAEFEGAPVQIAALCPYYVDSPMMDRGIAGLAAERGIGDAEARAEFGRRNPGGRWITLDEVARAAVELLEPGSNGRVVVLDGGPPREADPRGEPPAGVSSGA